MSGVCGVCAEVPARGTSAAAASAAAAAAATSRAGVQGDLPAPASDFGRGNADAGSCRCSPGRYQPGPARFSCLRQIEQLLSGLVVGHVGLKSVGAVDPIAKDVRFLGVDAHHRRGPRTRHGGAGHRRRHVAERDADGGDQRAPTATGPNRRSATGPVNHQG
jgi:hypothetical protein